MANSNRHLMRRAIALILLIVGCGGCIQYRKAYYASPINELSNAYTSIPLHADSLKSAYYLNSVVSAGGANDWGHDNTFSIQTTLSGANNFRHFQAFYAAGFLLGNYEMKPFDSSRNDRTVKPAILNQFVGKKFFGGIGISGGANVVGTFPHGSSEVRFGIETSLFKEFGHYLEIRKKLPDSAATYIITSDVFCTAGGHLELVPKMKWGSLAFKLSWGTVLGHQYHGSKAAALDYVYYNISLAPTIKRWTPYFQANFATMSNNVLFGLNYRLGK